MSTDTTVTSTELSTPEQEDSSGRGQQGQGSAAFSPEQLAAANEAVNAIAETIDDEPTSEDDESGEVAAAEAKVKAKAEEPEKPAESMIQKMTRLTKEKQAAREIRARAEREAGQAMQAARQEWQRLEQAKAELAKQQQWFDYLKKNPIQAVRASGQSAEDFLTSIANEGSPEAVAERHRQEQAYRIQQLENALQAQEEAKIRAAEEAKAEQWEQYKAKVETDYLSEAYVEDKYPLINTMYADRREALVNWGHEVAMQYRKMTASPSNPQGTKPSYSQICSYIEEVLQDRYQQASEKLTKGKVGKKPTVGPGNTGRLPRSLSDVNTERTTTTRRPETWEDRLEAANALVAKMARDIDT